MDVTVDKGRNSIRVVLDETLIPRSVGFQAAYHFLDRCYVRLERLPKRRLAVVLKGKEKLAVGSLEGLAGDFNNEVLHQLIRHQVAERTGAVREIIVGRALLSAEPIAQAPAEPVPGPDATPDYLDDPLGIAVPWEEKYGDEGKGSKKT